MTETALSFDLPDTCNYDYNATVYHHPLSPEDHTFLAPTSPPLPHSTSTCPDDTNNNNGNRGKRSQKSRVSTFITKLYGMVGDQKYRHLITWNPSGTSFLVYNATRFSDSVLPVHFKHRNFSSFVRQLNMYGFHKINKSLRGQRGLIENEIWEFSHDKFQYGRLELLETINRKAMDSEMLRREAGDIYASFNTVQLAQTDLLQQFAILQDHYSNLLQRFEELKKAQLQQQIILEELIEPTSLSDEIQFPQPITLIPATQWTQNDDTTIMYLPDSTLQSAPYLDTLPPSPVLSDPSTHSYHASFSNDSFCQPTYAKTNSGFSQDHLPV